MAEEDVTTERIVLGIGIEVDSGHPWYRVELSTENETLTLETTGGNGIRKPETVACLSLMLAAQLTGVPATEFLTVVNAYRNATGLPNLEDVAFDE